MEIPWTFSLNSSTFDDQRSASSYDDQLLLEQAEDGLVERLHAVLRRALCDRADGIRCVFSLSMMQSRMNGVLISTSTAGTRPLPSARGIRRIETTALSTLASWMRTCF